MSPNVPLLSGSSLESGVQIGDFRIERRLGAGGMGIVYQATQISLNRPVALKVLGQALTRDADLTRFQREAQAAARLRHPSIAQVYFIGQDRHLCYLAMELVEGISLRKVLDRLGSANSDDTGIDSVVQEDLQAEPHAQQVRFDIPTEHFGKPGGSDDKPHPEPPAEDPNPYLSPRARELRNDAAHVRRCCEVVRDAAQALTHAHEQGVIHRDMKPDNLLLDRKGKVYLIDFGIARFFDDQAVTYTGQLVGTPLYMSPEQVSGRGTIDARTDVYSLGLVFYELLTLRPAVAASNRENLLRSIVTKPLVPVSWRNAAVPAELERVVHKATQKDPDERYRSAAELAEELERHLAGKQVFAPPYRFRLDEREITAARPGGVVLAAFIFFMIASMVFLGLLSVAVMAGFIAGGWFGGAMAGMQALVGLFVLGVGIAVGYGLLAGHTWARWIGVVLAVLICLATLGGMTAIGSFAVWTVTSGELDKAFQAEGEDPTVDANAPFDPRRFLFGMIGMYLLPPFFGALLGGTALWCLLTREAGGWFRFASNLREEHRLLRHELR